MYAKITPYLWDFSGFSGFAGFAGFAGFSGFAGFAGFADALLEQRYAASCSTICVSKPSVP